MKQQIIPLTSYSEMEIRRITTADIDDLLDLWASVYAEGDFLAKGPPPRERVERTVSKVEKESIPNFVVIYHGHLIGASEVFPAPMCGIDIPDGDKLGILGIQIHADHRGKGIGRRLMDISIEDSRRYGFDKIELYVFNLVNDHLVDPAVSVELELVSN